MNAEPLIAVCLAIIGAITLLAIKVYPAVSRRAMEGWRQRRDIRRLKRQLPKRLKLEKERLCALWRANPAEQCATICKSFDRQAKKADSLEELADRVERALTAASSLFDQDFVERYADLYGNHVVERTTELAQQLATQYPGNAALILQRLAQNGEESPRCLRESIRDALSQGESDRVLIRAHLNQLIKNSDRFRRLLTPGFFRKYSTIVVGGAAGGLLGWLGINSPFLTYKASQFAARRWAAWKNRGDKEFGDSFVKALTKELPALCEQLDSRVRQTLRCVLDGYVDHKLKDQRAMLDVLFALSRAGRDVESAICWFRNAMQSD